MELFANIFDYFFIYSALATCSGISSELLSEPLGSWSIGTTSTFAWTATFLSLFLSSFSFSFSFSLSFSLSRLIVGFGKGSAGDGLGLESYVVGFNDVADLVFTAEGGSTDDGFDVVGGKTIAGNF